MPFKHRFRIFLATLVDVFTSRMSLVSAEFEDLILRLGAAAARLLLGALFACFSLSFLGLAIMMAVPDGYRWIPALAFMLLFAGGAAFCGWSLRKLVREMPAPFASTRDVLQRDAAALRPIIESATPASGTATAASEHEPEMAGSSL